MSNVNDGATPPMGGLEALVAAASAANQAGKSNGKGKRKRTAVDSNIDPALRVCTFAPIRSFSRRNSSNILKPTPPTKHLRC